MSLSKPKVPKLPKPAPVIEPPTAEQSDVASLEELRKKKAGRKGLESTVLTGQDGTTNILGG